MEACFLVISTFDLQKLVVRFGVLYCSSPSLEMYYSITITLHSLTCFHILCLLSLRRNISRLVTVVLFLLPTSAPSNTLLSSALAGSAILRTPRPSGSRKSVTFFTRATTGPHCNPDKPGLHTQLLYDPFYTVLSSRPTSSSSNPFKRGVMTNLSVCF
jgi:hypothetical protein